MHENADLYPSGVRITNPVELAWCRSSLWKALGTQPRRGARTAAPTAQPVSLHVDEVASLVERQDDFKVSLKADGVRFMLLLAQRPCSLANRGRSAEDTRDSDRDGFENVALMFDRALVPYEISLWAPRRLFEGQTLIDGELVVHSGSGAGAARTLTYLTFDIMLCAGTQVGKLHYDARLAHLSTLLDGVAYDEVRRDAALAEGLVARKGKMVVAEHDCDLRLAIKPCVALRDVRLLWEGRHTAGFKQDGLIFMPIRNPVRFGKHTGLYKWKDQHTIDVTVEHRFKRGRNGERLWAIYVVDHGAQRCASDPQGIVPVELEAGSGAAPVPFSCQLVDNLAMDGVHEVHQRRGDSGGFVVECSVEVDKERRLLRLYPIRHRPDKVHPNSLSTIESTVRNVLEHVHIEDLIRAVEEQQEEAAYASGMVPGWPPQHQTSGEDDE